MSYRSPVGDWSLTTGVSYRYEDLDSDGITADGAVVDGIDNYVYRVPGLFVQAYSGFFDDALEANASLRYDRHNVFGNIVTPRLNMLYHHTPLLSSRFSVGTGFRAPTSFFEEDHFDATPKRDKSPTFATLDLRGEYNINRNFSIYAGADNVLDYTQPDRESFLFLDGDGAVDITHIWGPSRGRFLYAGVKLAF